MEQDRARGGGGEKESGNDLSEPFGYECTVSGFPFSSLCIFTFID
jgi:hypothetical protein